VGPRQNPNDTFLPHILLEAFLKRFYGRASRNAEAWAGPGHGGDGLTNIGDELQGLNDKDNIGFGELSFLYLFMFMAFVGFVVLKRDAVAGTSRRIKERVRDINEKLGKFDEQSGQSMSFYG
jgi:hypothetical protein